MSDKKRTKRTPEQITALAVAHGVDGWPSFEGHEYVMEESGPDGDGAYVVVRKGREVWWVTVTARLDDVEQDAEDGEADDDR